MKPIWYKVAALSMAMPSMVIGLVLVLNEMVKRNIISELVMVGIIFLSVINLLFLMAWYGIKHK